MTRRTSKGSAAQSIVLAQEWLVSNSRGASRKLRFRHGDVEVVSGMELAELYYFTGNLSDDESVSANSFRLQQRTEPLLKDVAESLQALLGAASKARRAMDTYDRILNQFFEGGASSLQESSKRRRNTLVEIVAKTRELCSQTPQLAKRERGARIEAIARRANARGVIAAVRRMGLPVSPKSVAIAAVALQVDLPLRRDESFDGRRKKWGELIKAVERRPVVRRAVVRRV